MLVGTYNGLNSLKISNVEHFTYKNSNIHNDVLAFKQDHLGRIWVGTFGGAFVIGKKGIVHNKYGENNDEGKLIDTRVVSIESIEDSMSSSSFKAGMTTET